MGEDHCCVVHSEEEYLMSVRCGLWTVVGHFNGFSGLLKMGLLH